MSNCARCSEPLPSGKTRGNCERCRSLCPCGSPRAGSQGYCARCQRQRRNGTGQPQRRRAADPGDALRRDQKWFENGTATETRLPFVRIDLDVERSALKTRTFYRPDELDRYIQALKEA
jgi:hypothetical protein